MDSFMTSVNRGEKYPRDQKEATAVLTCKKEKQQVQEKVSDLLV